MKTLPLLYSTRLTTPLGPLSLAVDAQGRVAGAAFGDEKALGRRLGTATLSGDRRRTAKARSQVLAWFEGRRRTFTVGLAPAGSPFQRRVWRALAGIPYGETRSYGDLARSLKTSSRAVGRANATNPVCLIVPCHRVIGADGSLTGYAFGTARKRALLKLERR